MSYQQPSGQRGPGRPDDQNRSPHQQQYGQEWNPPHPPRGQEQHPAPASRGHDWNPSQPLGQYPAHPPQPYEWNPGHPPRRRSPHPGWPARALFWSAQVIDAIPGLVMVPLLYTSLGAAGSSIVGAVSMSVGLVALLLGIAGLLLVKGTSWTRRIVGAAVFAVASIYALVVPMLTPGLLYGSTFDVEFAVRAQQIVQVVNSIVIVSGVLIAWNVTRNRKWWLHLVAVGAAILSAGIVALTQFAFTTIHVLYPAMVPVTQILSLLLVFAALGVLHLLGSRPGAAVAVSASDPGAPAATRFGPG